MRHVWLWMGLLAMMGCAGKVSQKAAPTTAPAATIQSLNASALRPSDLDGKIVLINAWALNCPICIAEMPDLEKLYEKYKSQGVVILGFASCVPLGEKDVDLPRCTTRTKDFSYPLGVLAQDSLHAYLTSKGVGIKDSGSFADWIVGGEAYKTIYIGRDGKVRGGLKVSNFAGFEAELKKLL